MASLFAYNNYSNNTIDQNIEKNSKLDNRRVRQRHPDYNILFHIFKSIFRVDIMGSGHTTHF